MQIAVGGCLAQKDRDTITRKAPWVDVVFGTHNIGSLPVLLERARVAEEAQVEILESLEVFPSTLPTKRESAYAAWVSVSVGCNNTCTFCIVPALRGKEKDRRPGDILAEIEALVAEGVTEVTLLGQNVNAYGVEFGDRQAFSKLLRACGEIEGLERVRFTSPHPAEFTDDVIEAMAETPNVMPQLHMPLQSGSDRVLKAMRRSYRAVEVPRHHRPGARRHAGRRDHHRHHRRLPRRDRGGLPGHARRRPRRRASPAPSPSSTPSAPARRPPTMDDQVPPEVVKDRYERLVARGRRDRLGRRTSASSGRTRRADGRRGRGPQGRRHPPAVRARARTTGWCTSLPTSPDRASVRPGDMVTVEITYAAPHHLVADGPVLAVRRTRAGDAWEAGPRHRPPRRGRARHAGHRRPRPAAAGSRLWLGRQRWIPVSQVTAIHRHPAEGTSTGTA